MLCNEAMPLGTVQNRRSFLLLNKSAGCFRIIYKEEGENSSCVKESVPNGERHSLSVSNSATE